MAGNQKFCPTCGSPNTVESVFCMSCGARFPQAATAGTQATPPPVNKAGPPPLQKHTSDFITLSCPNCGGKLQITPDVERFACQFCGYEHIVRRSGGLISLEPVVQAMNMMGVGVSKLGFSSEKQVAEQTIARLKEEIAEINKTLGTYMDGQQTAMILGIVMCMIGVGLGIGAIIAEWGAWIIFVVLFFLGFGVPLTALSVKEPDTTKAIKKNLANKMAELERNYEIVRRT